MSINPIGQTKKSWSEMKWKRKDMLQINLEKDPRLNKTTNNNILDPSILDPLKLDPQTATMDDIAIHAKTEQYLSDNTITKRLRYLRFMETHEYPIDLRNPTEKEFIRHIRYRMYHETPPATIDALMHEKLAFNMLRKCYGQNEITIKFPRRQPNKKMIIPLPEIVRELWHHPYDKNKATRKLYQYMFRLSFLIGMRPPSEIANLKTSDILFNRNGTAILTIHEDKEHGRQRTIILPPAIATDPRQKSLLNWVESWRPRIANENCDALFPKKNGDYWNPPHLGKELRIQGKKVWEPYHPYVSRHWSCIARLIEQKERHDHWNTLVVKEWHGHDKIKNTEKYIKYARQYYAIAEYNWIQRVLKAPRCEDSTLKPTKPEKTPVSGRTPPVAEYGRGHTHTVFSLEKNQEKTKNPVCWIINLAFSNFSFQINIRITCYRMDLLKYFFHFITTFSSYKRDPFTPLNQSHNISNCDRGNENKPLFYLSIASLNKKLFFDRTPPVFISLPPSQQGDKQRTMQYKKQSEKDMPSPAKTSAFFVVLTNRQPWNKRDREKNGSSQIFFFFLYPTPHKKYEGVIQD